MKRTSICRLLVVTVFFASVTLNADTLVLRDGRRVEGQLISVYNNVIEFEEVRQFGAGRAVRLDRNDVVAIQFDRNDGNAARFPQAPASPRGRLSGLRERQVMVAADIKWTDTNVDVRSGQDVFFEPSGEVRWGPGRRAYPVGETNSPMNPNRPIPNRPGAALIGRVGEGSTDYFFIGGGRGAFQMRSSGRLFLGINDDNLQDNSGYFRVVVHY
jgi:hypothetical protein